MIQIYSKNNCQFCDKAKGLLDLKGVKYDVIKIDEDNNAREFMLAEGHRSVPQIYIDGVLLEGGYTGLVKQSPEFFDKLKKD